MDINLKDTLKSLRQQKNVTQETLAEYLGITQQSVGKWERGEGFPDISLLPKIALYFNVSIDDLLNVGQARIDEKIKEYTEQSKVFEKSGDIDARISLWEKAYAEFPNSHFVMEKLKTAIELNCPWPIPQDKAERIITLSTRILDESTDTKLRESAIFSLCSIYEITGDTEKALNYADMCGSMHYCRERMRASALKGEEGIKETQSCLLQYIFCASQEAITLSSKNPSEEINAIQFSIDVMKLLFSDGNCGGYTFDMSWRYLLLASAYAQRKDIEKTFEALEECVQYCIMDAQKAEGVYTAPLIDRLDYGKHFSKNFKGNACNARLCELASWINFNFIREHPKFIEFVKTLEQYAVDV